jgi:hypothetical protein
LTDPSYVIQTWQLFTGIIVFIITILGTAIPIIRYYLKLRNDVDNLKDDINRLRKEYEEHPVITAHKQWSSKDGVFMFFNNNLKNSSVEKID